MAYAVSWEAGGNGVLGCSVLIRDVHVNPLLIFSACGFSVFSTWQSTRGKLYPEYQGNGNGNVCSQITEAGLLLGVSTRARIVRAASEWQQLPLDARSFITGS